VRQSNAYVLFYAAALTIVCGVLLAVAAEGLKPFQNENVALERKANILGAAITLEPGADISAIYAERVRAYVVNFQGEVLEGISPDSVMVEEEYRKPLEQRLLPVYEIRNETNPEQVDNYVVPLYGFGLWNNIWGFIALESNLSTVAGANFAHAGETPGLGARIATAEIQQRYEGKEVFDGATIRPITMMKGEGNDYTNDPHRVDGMSGSTITAKGLNEMIAAYLRAYENFLKSRRGTNT
jgi:Na+-transporting NADH:ubiquinone oxidoreductase subunit C